LTLEQASTNVAIQIVNLQMLHVIFTQSIANNETQRTCSVVENNFPLFIFHFPFLLQVLFSLNKGDDEFNWHFPISLELETCSNENYFLKISLLRDSLA
jgi:hypothetical protein